MFFLQKMHKLLKINGKKFTKMQKNMFKKKEKKKEIFKNMKIRKSCENPTQLTFFQKI